MQDEMEKELEPCPFCGGLPHFEKRTWLNNTYDYYFTHTCKGATNKKHMEINGSGYKTKQEVIESWNRRY